MSALRSKDHPTSYRIIHPSSGKRCLQKALKLKKDMWAQDGEVFEGTQGYALVYQVLCSI